MNFRYLFILILGVLLPWLAAEGIRRLVRRRRAIGSSPPPDQPRQGVDSPNR